MGLFTVRRHVIVQERDTNRFSCQVQELSFDQEKERHIDITGEMFHRAHPWKVSFAVFFTLAALLLAGSAVLIYRCVKLRRKKEKISREKDHLSTLLGKLS
ncbi:butyrophilin subfamily 1 member A1-like [Arapaima gigas]